MGNIEKEVIAKAISFGITSKLEQAHLLGQLAGYYNSHALELNYSGSQIGMGYNFKLMQE